MFDSASQMQINAELVEQIIAMQKTVMERNNISNYKLKTTMRFHLPSPTQNLHTHCDSTSLQLICK